MYFFSTILGPILSPILGPILGPILDRVQGPVHVLYYARKQVYNKLHVCISPPFSRLTEGG